MGRQIGMVLKFTGVQKHWQNSRRANGIWVAYFPKIQYVAVQWRSQKFIVEMRWDTREFHRKNYIHVDVQRYLMWIKGQWKRMRVKFSTRFSTCKEIWKRTMVISWSWFWEKWYSISGDSPQGEWDNMAERMLLEFAESGHPIFRATSPLSRGQLKSKGHGQLSIHCSADLETIETIFRVIVSANPGQSLRSIRRNVWRVRNVLLGCDDLANKDLLLHQYGERIEKLSQQDKLSKLCMDAGFLNVVEIGQNFMTKDTADFSQFHAVVCREYTLPWRRRSITTIEVDPREHENWARIGSCKLLFAW